MSNLWLEAWTRPGHATFGRIHDYVPFTQAGISEGLNRVGGGDMSLPESWPFFDDLVFTDPTTPLNSVSSLVRVYSGLDPTVPIFEWLPEDLLPAENREDLTVEVSGDSIKGILGYARVEAFDWDGSDDFAPVDPDWLYGGSNRILNDSFEDSPLAIPNPGFEDGTREPWWPGAVEGVSANASIVTGANVDTGTYALSVTPLLAQGGASTTFRVQPANFYTVTARFKGASGVDYQIGASGPAELVATPGTVLVEVAATPQGWEVQKTFAGTGAYQTVTLGFGSAGNQSSTQLSIREGEAVLDGSTFYIDLVTVTGFGIGTDPWQPTGVNVPNIVGPVTTFEVRTTHPKTGTYSLFLTARPGHGAFQELNGIQAGATYTAGVSIGYASVASLWALEVRDAQGNILGQASATIGTGAYTDLTVTFTAPEFVPGSSGSAFLRVINYAAVTRSVYVDDGIFYQGQSPDTVGKILGDLYADATLDHVTVGNRLVWEDEANPGTPYLTLDFSDTLDSAGAAWDNPSISIRITMRQSYSQVMANFATNYGYEYRIIPDNPELGTWLWQVFNPGTMMTDYTAAATPGIQGGSTDVSRSVRRFVPGSTDILVEGQNRVTGRDRSADLMTALGRLEGSTINREATDFPSVSSAAAESVATGLSAGRSYAYTLVDPQDEPLSTYLIGDLLTIVDPPEILDVDSRFVDVTATLTPLSVKWAVQFGSASLTADAKLADAVEKVVNRFIYPDEIGGSDTPAVLEGEKGGMMTVAVAASDAAPISQSKADFICDGVDDEVEIMTAMQLCWAAGGGTVWLSEGHFEVNPDIIVVGYSIGYPEPITLRGLGYGTKIRFISFTNFVIHVAPNSKLLDMDINLSGIG